MTRFTVLSDIASRVMHATAGSPRTVAAAVVVDTAKISGVRKEVAKLPKWKSCTEDDAEFAVDLMLSQCIAVSVINVNRETQAWTDFLQDAEVLHKAIVSTSRKIAGWAKPANLLKFS